MTQDLSITTFRYLPRDLRTNMHEAHVERHLTARADVEALPEIVARVGRKVDAELRTTS
jgi:hypothetical protein